MTDTVLKSLGKELVTCHFRCLVLLPLPWVRRLSERSLFDCRTKNPKFLAQGSFSCSLQKVSQSLRLGLGLASPAGGGCRYHTATSKVHSKLVAKLTPPCSNSGLPCKDLHCATRTLTLHPGTVSCLDTATMDTTTNKQQLCV